MWHLDTAYPGGLGDNPDTMAGGLQVIERRH